jgi:hypothetical protein
LYLEAELLAAYGNTWVSSCVVISVGFDENGTVRKGSIQVVRVRPMTEGPITMLRRWLRL